MRNLLILIVLLFPAFSFGQAGTYQIKGHITEWKGTDTIAFTQIIDQKAIIDTILSKDGIFLIKGNMEEPCKVYLRLLKGRGLYDRPDAISFYLENGTITITATDSMRHATIKSGIVNADLKKREDATKSLNDRMTDLRIQAGAAVKNHDSLARITINKQYNAARDSLIAMLTKFIYANPQSFISLETVNSMAGSVINYAIIAPLFNSLSASVRKYTSAVALEKRLKVAATIGIGLNAPAFRSTTVDGDSLSLYTVVKKGKITLVDFWASWCGPCRKENPNVVKAYTAFHDKGFNILSVSLDDKQDKWKAAIDKDGMPWYHVSGLKGWMEPIALQYGISAVPDNLLLDENGKILARGLRGEALYEKLEALLK
jgi:thiol-disulfide isomerase/thioredoxin